MSSPATIPPLSDVEDLPKESVIFQAGQLIPQCTSLEQVVHCLLDMVVEEFRPVMARVDKALESHCDMSGLSQKVEEHCPRGPFRPTNCTP